MSRAGANYANFRAADRINGLYGGSGGATTSQQADTSSDTPTVNEARQKMQANPGYAGFRDAMRNRQNLVDVDQLNTQDLGELFQAFKDNQEKEKHVSMMADEMRSNYRNQDK